MDPGPVRIYSTHNSPRLRYIAALLLGEILGLQWEITGDKRRMGKRPVINYSEENIPGSFRIIPDTLLFEKGVRQKDITVTQWNNLPVFFRSQGESDFPFDVFAASFYLVSRYEEYLDVDSDEHGRYRASSSIAFKNGFLKMPVVDLWARELAKAFIRNFRNVVVRRNEFKSILTIDADEPYANPGSNFLSSIGSFVGELKNQRKNAAGRTAKSNHDNNDPYDVFGYITTAIQESGAEARFFFPVGDRSKYDRNPSWRNTVYRDLICGISAGCRTGLHPSYFSFQQAKRLAHEKERLFLITGSDVAANRFHYLRFRLPVSYRQLLEAGFVEDYSMGYPDEPGYRAGVARPFFFYDVEQDRQTPLRIYPFMIMDETLFSKRKLGKDEAVRLLISMIGDVRRAGGTFISIWHNTSLLDTDEGHSGREVLKAMLASTAPDASS